MTKAALQQAAENYALHASEMNDKTRSRLEDDIIKASESHVIRYYASKYLKIDEDAIQWIRISILKALRTYQSNSSKFLTWAISCARDPIFRDLRYEKELIHIPNYLSQIRHRITKYGNILEAKGETATDDEISRTLGIPSNYIGYANGCNRMDFIQLYEDTEISDDTIPDLHSMIFFEEIEKHLNSLPSISAKALRMKLDESEYSEIMGELNISATTLRRILGYSIPILKKIIISYYDFEK
jgi:RNA polymerase sigma factor (sigma-70 family)